MKVTRSGYWKIMCGFTLVTALALVSSVFAETVAQDFESETADSTTPPAGWSYVLVHSDPDNEYIVTTNGFGGGLAGQISGNNAVNALHPPGCYIVNSGSPALDLTKPISGTFRYYVMTAERASGGDFIFGDIKTGVTGVDVGQYLGMQMMNDSFGNRGGVINGAGNQVSNFSGNQIGLNWYEISFSWNPTNNLTGNFSASGTGTSKSWSVSYDGFTFASRDAYFGFGAGDYYNNTKTVLYDDINITGSTETPSGTLIMMK